MQNIKIIVMDMDGTLLTSDKIVTDYTKNVFDKLKEEGYKLGIASGRPIIGVKRSVASLGIEKYIDFMVGSNGAELYDVSFGEENKFYQLEPETVHEIINEVKDELIDRFGKLDESILAYMYEELFEKKANELKINKIIQTKNFIEVYIPKEITDVIDGSRLFVEISKISRMFRFSMRNKQLIIILDTVKLDKHFIFYLNDLLDIIKKNI